MSAIGQALLDVLQVLAAVPVIPFLIVYFTGAVRGIERKKAFRMAMDTTTAFLIAIVATLLNHRSQSHFGIYLILLLMLISAVWRLSFFAMGFLYVLLMSLQLLIPPHSN